jgi:hypothetical protein
MREHVMAEIDDDLALRALFIGVVDGSDGRLESAIETVG